MGKHPTLRAGPGVGLPGATPLLPGFKDQCVEGSQHCRLYPDHQDSGVLISPPPWPLSAGMRSRNPARAGCPANSSCGYVKNRTWSSLAAC